MRPDSSELGRFTFVSSSYTQHRLQPPPGQVLGDLLVFYKRGTDGAPVVAAVQRDAAANCAFGECSGRLLRSETPFSRLELLTVERWLLASPLSPWLQTNITTPELRNDSDPTLVQVMVRAPEMAHETIRAMLADQSLSSDMILLGPRARYSN
jgi:hypothetical protein